MKIMELIMYIVIFNGVMLIMQGAGIFKTGVTWTDYAITFGYMAMLGGLVGLSGAAIASYLFQNMERSIEYGALSTFLIAFFGSAFVPFDALVESFPVGIAILALIKIIVGGVILFWMFQMVFGGAETYR